MSYCFDYWNAAKNVLKKFEKLANFNQFLADFECLEGKRNGVYRYGIRVIRTTQIYHKKKDLRLVAMSLYRTAFEKTGLF